MYSDLARNPIYTVILRLFHQTHWKNDFLQNIVWPFIVWSTEWKTVYSNCKFQSNTEDSMKLNKHTTQQMNNACMCCVQMCIYIHMNVCTNSRFWIESFSIANIHHICIKWIVKMQFLLDLSFISSYYFVHSFLLLSLTLYHKYTYICTMCNVRCTFGRFCAGICNITQLQTLLLSPSFQFWTHLYATILIQMKTNQTKWNDYFFQIFVLYSNILRRHFNLNRNNKPKMRRNWRR